MQQIANNSFQVNPTLEPWIETYTGKHLYFLDPKPDQIDILDIATALSNECRFGGHTSSFYSVAEHSILVASLCPRPKQLWGLMHDASEAFLRDIASPIKQYLANYKELEAKLMEAICERFELPKDFWHDPDIKEADIMALKVEAKYLLPSGGKDWIHLYPTAQEAQVVPRCMAPAQARDVFLQAFADLTQVIVTPPERKIILAR